MIRSTLLSGVVAVVFGGCAGMSEIGESEQEIVSKAFKALNVTFLANNQCAIAGTGSITPAPSEDGHRLAVRLTPPAYPFIVRGVGYLLEEWSGACDSQLAHDVELYVSNSITPDATPTVLRSWNVAAGSASLMPGSYVKRHSLSSPLVLHSGEYLYVSIQMRFGAEAPMCMRRCDELVEDADYWSNAPAPAYPWQELDTWGIHRNAAVWARGEAGPPF